MSRLVIFGCGDIAQLAHYYFSTDSEHETVAFTVDRSYVPESGVFCDLPVVAFEELEAHFAPGDHLVFVALSYALVGQSYRASFSHWGSLFYSLPDRYFRRGQGRRVLLYRGQCHCAGSCHDWRGLCDWRGCVNHC
jgi:hypothetical protein